MTPPDFAVRNQVDVLLRERKDALTLRWLGATVAIGGCAVVLAIFGQNRPRELPVAVAALMWLLGIGLAGSSVWLPRRLLRDAQLTEQLRLPVDVYAWSRAMKLTPQQKDVFGAWPPSEQSVFALTMLFERPYNLALGLAFGVALVGLGYGLLTRTLIEAAPFLLGALGLNCWHYPRLLPLLDRGRKLLAAEQEAATLRELLQTQQAKEAAPRPQRKSQGRARPPGPAGPTKP